MSDMPQEIGLPIDIASKPAAGMTSRVVRGSLWSLGGQGVLLLVSLVTTPFIIRLLGTERYGVLALINILIGYLAFSEFGMGVASTRFGSEAHARSDTEGEAAVIWTSLWIAAIPALLVSLTFALAARPLVEHALRLPVHLHEAAIIALRLAAVGFLARTLAGVVNTPQVVRLRMDLVTKINTGGYIGQTILILVVLLLGGGLIGAVAIVAGVNVLIAIVFALVSLRLLPRLVRPQISSVLLKPLLRFGSALVVTSLAGIVLVNAEKVLLARYASVTALAHYSVAFALAMMLSQVPSAMNQSLLPALSHLQTGLERESLHKLCRRAIHGTLFWVIPAALLMCVAAKPFFTLWAGPEFGRESTLPFYILVAGLVFNLLAWVPYNLLIAMGRTGLIARFHLAEIIPYLILATLLSRSFGAVGAALTWTLRVIISSPLVFLFARRVSGVSLSPLPNNPLAFGVSLAVLMLPTLLAIWLWNSPAVSIPVAVASVVAYATLIWTRVLTDEERAGIRLMVPLKILHRRIQNGETTS